MFALMFPWYENNELVLVHFVIRFFLIKTIITFSDVLFFHSFSLTKVKVKQVLNADTPSSSFHEF